MIGYKVEKIKLNRSGVKNLLQSDGVMNALKENANAVGDGDIISNYVGFDRCHVLVRDSNGNRRDRS